MSDGLHSQRLSQRQREVLELVAAGFSNAQIAHRLHVSQQTAAYHVAKLMNVFDARCRTALVARAYSEGALAIDRWPPQVIA